MKWYIVAYNVLNGRTYGAPGLYGPFDDKNSALEWWQLNVPNDVVCEFVRNQVP